MHEGALVLVGFMWSLSVLTRLFSLFSLSHVSDVAAIVHPQNINVNVMGGYIYLVNKGRQGILCLLAVRDGVGVAT